MKSPLSLPKQIKLVSMSTTKPHSSGMSDKELVGINGFYETCILDFHDVVFCKNEYGK